MKFKDFEERLVAFKSFTNNDEKGIFDKLRMLGYFSAPASTKYHLAYEGGLFEHSINVAVALIELTYANGLKWQRKESPVYIGLLHDLCKCDQYIKDGDIYRFNTNTTLVGHGDKSATLAKKLLDITEEEEACIINHMGAFDEKDKWTRYTNAIHKFPNVLWTHTADMIASHIVEERKE